MKVKLNKLAALLLGGVALLAAGCTDYEVDIQKNADAIATANQQIDALQKTIEALQTAHNADVSSLNQAIKDLEDLMKKDYATKKELTDAINSLKNNELKNLQDQINALPDKAWVQAQIQALVDGEIANLKSRVASLEAFKEEMTKKDGIIDQINAQIAALRTDVGNLQETQAILSKAVAALAKGLEGFKNEDGTYQDVKGYIDSMEESLKTYVNNELKKYVTLEEFNALKKDLTARVSSLEKSLAGFKNEDGSYQDVKKYIDGEVTKLNKAIETINGEITALKDRMTAAEDAIDKAAKSLEKLWNEFKAAKAAIRSLVFVPEVYVDGVEAILIQTLTYYPQLLNEKDTEEEVAEEVEDSLVVSPKVIAKYHVIPSNADLSFLAEGDTVAFVRRDNDPFKTIRTRAKASEDFNVVGVYKGVDPVEEDVICIEVTVEGTAATDDYISVVALQLTKDEEMYTSDYATVFSEALCDLRIAMPQEDLEADYHYRRALEAIAGTDDEAGIPDLEVYLEELNIESCDTSLVYDVPMDLYSITEAHVLAEGEEGCVVIDPTKLELKWFFELVDIEDWELGDLTYITLEDGKVTAGIDAMDLTPVVRVSLLPQDVEEEDVDEDTEFGQIAYIKFYVAPQDFDAPVDMGQFTFSCEGDSLQTEEVNIYEQLGMSKETFERVYPNFMTEDPDAEAEEEGEAEEEEEEEEGDAEAEDEEEEETEEEPEFEVTFDPETGILQWKGSAEWLWNNAVAEEDAPGEPLTTEVYFVNPNNGAKITVKLSALPAVIKAYRIPIDHYIENYWTAGWDPTDKVADDDIVMDYALYNVFTPGVGEKNDELCIFENNINAAFYTDASGVIDLSDIGDPGLQVTTISYYFCREHMEKITKVGKIDVKFEVPEDSTKLNATVKINGEEVTEQIARIENFGDEIPNVVYLEKESEVAKLLLNTMKEIKVYEGKEYPMPGELYICIAAKGILCGDENGEGGFEVNLFWPENGENPDVWVDHFKAKYRQPVYLSDSAADVFIDAVDFGEGGSFINIKELVNPKDWRARPFEPQKDENFVVKEGQVDGIDYYSNYWEYYGPITVEVIDTAITCNLGANGAIIDLPTTIIVDAPVMKADLSAQIVDDSVAYREKDGSDSGMTIAEKIESINDMIDDENEAGFITYHNNGTNVTKDYELYIPVKLTYGWGVIEKVITVKVYRTTDSFQNK